MVSLSLIEVPSCTRARSLKVGPRIRTVAHYPNWRFSKIIHNLVGFSLLNPPFFGFLGFSKNSGRHPISPDVTTAAAAPTTRRRAVSVGMPTRSGRVTFDGDEDGWEHERLGRAVRRWDVAAFSGWVPTLENVETQNDPDEWH